MQTSNSIHVSIRLFYFSLLVITAVVIWFSQNSINAYWQQTYHQDSPLMVLNKFSWWVKGGELQQKITEQYQAEKTVLEDIELFSTSHIEQTQLPNGSSMIGIPLEQHSEMKKEETSGHLKIELAKATPEIVQIKLETPADNLSSTPIAQAIEILPSDIMQSAVNIKHKISSSQNVESHSTALLHVDTPVVDGTDNHDTNIVESTIPQDIPKVFLSATDKVLFAGDSLMQGVAPHIQKWLKRNYKIQSINLSKQSTGLSYPSFFDWPKTIEDTLKQNPDIRLIVVFLGPNDPWDFPAPDKKYKYLKFQSEEWETIYKQRIERILTSAKRHQASIIWLGIPYMKKAKLNSQMAYLNQILMNTVAPKAILLPTEKLLSGGEAEYLDTITYQGKKVRVRSKDGIHFSLDGQRILADYVQQHISTK